MTQVDLKELGASLLLTDRMVRELHNQELVNRIHRMQADAFVRRMVIGGQCLTFHREIENEVSREPDIRAYDIQTVAWVEEDPRGAALIAKALALSDLTSSAVQTVNSIPWWRILWMKLRRKPLVEVNWESP